MRKQIPYGRQWITEEDKAAVLEALESDFLTQGPKVNEFESALNSFLGARYGVAVSNGTTALHLAAVALGVTPGQTVLVTPNTFVASANCIRYCGGDVEFADIDPRTLCLDLDLLEQKLKSNPKKYTGVVCVDFAGYPANFERLRRIADDYGVWLIEDACHALGASFVNTEGVSVKSGSSQYADVSVFSFHPVKHLAMGEGGFVTCRNEEIYQKIKLLRTHGIVRDEALLIENHGPWYHEMQVLGFNYRIPDILCALGLSQLKRLDANIQRRQEIARRYAEGLGGVGGLELPNVPEGLKHAYHLYVAQTPARDRLFSHLREHGVYPQVHYIPVYRQPYYKQLYGTIRLPVMESYYSRCLSLPMYHALTDEDQHYVIETVKGFFK